MVRQSSAGIYSWLPLGFRVLQKVEQIVREEQDAERRRLHRVIEAMVPWEASNNEAILNAARWEIARSVAWGLGEEPPALLVVGPVEAHDQRGGDVHPRQGLHDPVGDLLALGDAAEDVDEDRLHLVVGVDDLEGVGHHVGRRAAADVEEVGRLHAAVVLPGVRDDVQGRHDQAGTVTDDANFAVELYIVEVERLGLCL